MLKAEASATDINSSETKMTLKKKICAAHRQGKKDTLAAKSHPPPIFSGEAHASACCSSISLDFDGAIFSQLPRSFWHRQKSFKKVLHFIKVYHETSRSLSQWPLWCATIGRDTNGRGCVRRKPAFRVESWQASPSFCQQLGGLIRCTERAEDALVSGGSKQENEFHHATQPLCISNMVWLDWGQPRWKFGHLCHQGPGTDGGFDYELDQL